MAGIWIILLLSATYTLPLVVPNDSPAGLASASVDGNLEFTGQVAFETVDEDTNGLAEALAVDAEVRVLEAGKYLISGYLSRQGEFITNGPRRTSPRFSTDFLDVDPGTYVAHLEFSGEDIFEHGGNGPYDVELRAAGSSGLEDTLECSTPSYAYTIFGEVMATLTSATDGGVDLDGDGNYDVLRTTLRASVRAPGLFVLSGGLSRNFVSITDAGVNVPLQAGDQIVNLDFSGIEIRKKNIDGPYDLSVCIRDTVEFNASCLEHTTGPYSASEFDVSALTPTGSHSDEALDLDEDGAYDILRTSFEVSSEVSGPVTIMGTLTEQAEPGEESGPYIAIASDSAELVEGIQTLTLDFRGVDIRKHGTDGPYVLGHVGVLDEDYHAVDNLILGYPTNAYLASQFEEGPPVLTYLDSYTDAPTAANSNGYFDSLTVSLSVQSSQDVVVLGSAILYDGSGKFIANGTGEVGVTGGLPAALDIRFDGRYIFGNLKDGPFEVKRAYIYHSRGVLDGVEIPVVGKTAAYKYTIFERAAVITGVVEAAPGTPAVEAEVRSSQSLDYTDSSGSYRLIYLRSGTTLVRAKHEQIQCWNIVLNDQLVATGDSVRVDVAVGEIDTLQFLASDVGSSQSGRDIQTRVEKFVRGKYVHGVPYFQARELGAEAIPILHAMLRDTSEVEWWSTIVMTIGFIGDSSSVDTLIDFLENRFEGEVTLPQFQALLPVGTALGVIAANGSLSALEYLSNACYVRTWLAKGPQWHFRHYSGESLAILLAEGAVSGLGYSGTDRAKEILIDLRRHPESEKSAVSLKSNIKEGLERIDRIQKEGADKVFGGQ